MKSIDHLINWLYEKIVYFDPDSAYEKGFRDGLVMVLEQASHIALMEKSKVPIKLLCDNCKPVGRCAVCEEKINKP